MYVLDKKLSIADVGELTDSLASLLEDDKELVMDANSIESVDIAVLQVLVAFSNAALEKSKSVHWRSESGTFRESTVLAGVDSLFSFDAPAPNAEGTEASVEKSSFEEASDKELPVEEDDGLCPVF